MFMLPLLVSGLLVIVRALPVSVIPTLVNPVFVSAAHSTIPPEDTFNTCPAEPIANLANVDAPEAYSISPVV